MISLPLGHSGYLLAPWFADSKAFTSSSREKCR